MEHNVAYQIKKQREVILYLIFGALAAGLNILAYYLCAQIVHFSTYWSTTIAWVTSTLFAYWTNRTKVFCSRSSNAAAAKEFMLFIGCRVITYLLDASFMLFAVDWFAPRFVPVEFVALWGIAAKAISNVIVIVLNYIFSKMLIFKQR